MSWSRDQLEATWGPMVRTARSVLGSREEAEECAAQALAQILERQPTDVANLQAYMVTVAKRRAIDRLRVVERARHRDERLCGQIDWCVADIAEDIVARAEARWADREARAVLQPNVYRLLQMIADGHDIGHVAEQLGMTRRAAQSHLHRARRMLREALLKISGLIAVSWYGLRRTVSTSMTAPTAAAMVLLLVGPVVGVFGGAPGPPGVLPAPQLAVTPFRDAASTVATTTLVNAQYGSPTSGSASTHEAPSALSGRRSRPVLKVQEPLGATTTVEKRDNGSGPPAGPVETMFECLNNFTVTPEHVGC